MKRNTYQKTQPPHHPAHTKRETVLTVPGDREPDREQKEKAVADETPQVPLAPPINGSVPVSER